jgi:hypothetical protein
MHSLRRATSSTSNPLPKPTTANLAPGSSSFQNALLRHNASSSLPTAEVRVVVEEQQVRLSEAEAQTGAGES